MPECDEGEDDRHVHDGPTCAAEGNVYVAHDPAVETAVPGTPEGERRVVVAHAAQHVLWWVHMIH